MCHPVSALGFRPLIDLMDLRSAADGICAAVSGLRAREAAGQALLFHQGFHHRHIGRNVPHIVLHQAVQQVGKGLHHGVHRALDLGTGLVQMLSLDRLATEGFVRLEQTEGGGQIVVEKPPDLGQLRRVRLNISEDGGGDLIQAVEAPGNRLPRDLVVAGPDPVEETPGPLQ